MHPLFTPYGKYAIFALTPRFGDQPFSAHYGAWLFDAATNSYTGVLQGSVPGTFPTEEEAREAALVAVRKALDALNSK